ncbi:MAG: FmdB family zinc ribbon protein [Dehalococcoidia bacterium]
MPIYSYRCDACDNEFDIREGFDAPTVRDCTCGEQKTARRVIHPVGVIYKGSGFYTTDYARKGSSGSSSSSGSSNGTGGNGSSSEGASDKSSTSSPISSDSTSTTASTSSDKT